MNLSDYESVSDVTRAFAALEISDSENAEKLKEMLVES
jgi:hypothetical protein